MFGNVFGNISIAKFLKISISDYKIYKKYKSIDKIKLKCMFEN